MYTLAHLHVICRDMEKMIRFWREALGAEFVEYRTFGDDPGAIMRFGGLEIYFKEIPQAKELQSGQSATSMWGCMCRISRPAWNPWSRALAVRWRPCPPIRTASPSSEALKT